MKDDETEHTHPSYGVLMFMRATNGGGDARLFGSALDRHYGVVRLRIGPAKLVRDGYHDRVMHASGNDLIEVEMSAAQFAEAITTMNQYPGTPCTIRYVDGEDRGRPPAVATEADAIRTGFTDKLKDYVRDIHKRRLDVDALLDKQKISQKAREAIKIALDVMEYPLKDNAPFVLRQFMEATTKVVTAAKNEVEAFIGNRLGVASQISATGMAPQLVQGNPEADTNDC